MLNRRSFITGLIAAPAIVKAASLMPVRGVIMDVPKVAMDLAGAHGSGTMWVVVDAIGATSNTFRIRAHLPPDFTGNPLKGTKSMLLQMSETIPFDVGDTVVFARNMEKEIQS